LKAERAWFLTEKVRRAEPETEPLLTRWGKSGVFSESTVLSFLKQSSGPTSSDSLEEQFGKAKSSDVAQFISKCSILFCILQWKVVRKILLFLFLYGL
jgi:hypothetical protein